MQSVANQLLDTLDQALPLLRQMPENEASVNPAPGKWSNKEILGHLIDSAANNHQKFVRTMQAETTLDFVGYAQNFWVEAQGYKHAGWTELQMLWEGYNRHLAHLIRTVDASKLTNTITIDGTGPFTLAFIMSDYVEHLKHHLNQIFPDAGFKSSFENIY